MLNVKYIDLKKTSMDILVIPVCEDEAIHENRTLTALAKKAAAIRGFKGEKGDEAVFFSPDGIQAEQVVCMGLGKAEKLDAEALRTFAGKAVKYAMPRKPENLWIAAPSEKKTGLSPEQIAQALLEGAGLANYVFDEYKSEKKLEPLADITIRVQDAGPRKYAGLAARIDSICTGTHLARRWVSRPSNLKLPERYAASIVEEAKKAGLKITVLDEKELAEKNFGAMLAVGQGSAAPPRLVVLEYRAKGAKKTVALVGKGVTFDSGGIDIKPGAGMETMKMDMAGSAAVAATLITAARLKLKVNLVGLMPLVENMPSGTAIRPGDIITTYSGKTVEIGNTDAEGRLILCDALAYAAEQYKPDAIIDLATLTGACLIALGDRIAGVFSSDEALAALITDSGKNTGERCWTLPLPDDYREYLKSNFADINNMSNTRAGGAITAALFLSEFVKESRWAHIDIAGPAYVSKAEACCPPGGTGFGVRLLCDLLEKI